MSKTLWMDSVLNHYVILHYIPFSYKKLKILLKCFCVIRNWWKFIIFPHAKNVETKYFLLPFVRALSNFHWPISRFSGKQHDFYLCRLLVPNHNELALECVLNNNISSETFLNQNLVLKKIEFLLEKTAILLEMTFFLPKTHFEQH